MTEQETKYLYARLRVLRDIADGIPLTPLQERVARELIGRGLIQETSAGYIITARGYAFVNQHKHRLSVAYEENMGGDKLLNRARSWVSLMEQIDRKEGVEDNNRNNRNIALMIREGLIVFADGQYSLTPDGMARWQEYSQIVSSAPPQTRRRDRRKRRAFKAPAPVDMPHPEPVAPASEPDDSDDLRAMRDDVITTIEEIGGKPVAPHVRILRHLNRLLDRR